MELAWRLFVAGVAIVGPTLLFLGFWRGLMWLRDDELVRRVYEQMDEQPSSIGFWAPALKGEGETPRPSGDRQETSPTPPKAERTVSCSLCGLENDARFDYCRRCQSALGDG